MKIQTKNDVYEVSADCKAKHLIILNEGIEVKSCHYYTFDSESTGYYDAVLVVGRVSESYYPYLKGKWVAVWFEYCTFNGVLTVIPVRKHCLSGSTLKVLPLVSFTDFASTLVSCINPEYLQDRLDSLKIAPEEFNSLREKVLSLSKSVLDISFLTQTSKEVLFPLNF